MTQGDTTVVPKLLLTSREAARALSISQRTLWSLTAPRGPIPAVHLSRSVRYSEATLRRWIADQEVGR